MGKTVSFSSIKDKRHILILAAVIILISWPVLFMDMVNGHDMRFHLLRIEGLLHTVSFSDFPVRLSSEWLNGYGYPVSVYYGDLFLYVAVMFRKIGVSIEAAYILFVVFINAITVVIAFRSFKALFGSNDSAVLTTILYSAASYRLVDIYVRAAIGEILAIAFLPAVFACIYLLLSSDDPLIKKKYILFLAMSLAAIINSHVLSSSMVFIAMIPVCCIGVILLADAGKRIRKLLSIVLACGLSVVLSGSFLIPFLDYYFSEDIVAKADVSHHIQEEGLGLADYLDFLSNPFCNEMGNIQRTPGAALICVFAIALMLCVAGLLRKLPGKLPVRLLLDIIFAVLFAYMTSSVFPWDYIENNIPFGKIFTSIQFPMRYLSFVILFLAFLAGDITCFAASFESEKLKHIWIWAGIVVCALSLYNVIHISYYYGGMNEKVFYAETDDLGEWRSGAMEYAFEGVSLDDLSTDIVTEGMAGTQIISREGNDYVISCISGPEYGWVQLPLFNYKYYRAEDLNNPQVRFDIHDGGNRTVGVLLPANYTGYLHVYWQEPILWRVAECITLISLLGCLVWMIFSKSGMRRR